MNLSIIILAGGKGTRIKSVLQNTPKILAPVAGKPFLDWLLLWIDSWQLKIQKNIILSTCIGHEKILNYCVTNHINVECISEEKPLGTFGAIANVASANFSEAYLILNGDTIFKANIGQIYNEFKENYKTKPMIILKEIEKNSRYGGYKKVLGGWRFSKQKTNYISLGSFFISYAELKKRWIKSTSIPFETNQINGVNQEIMIDNKCLNQDPISARVLELNTPFIDIGIPSSLKEGQKIIPEILL